MTAAAKSIRGVSIRLTDERWAHIEEEHAELVGLRGAVLDTIAKPERVLEGGSGELLAVGPMESGRALVVVYREVDNKDGFVITAFRTSRMRKLDRRRQLWPLKT